MNLYIARPRQKRRKNPPASYSFDALVGFLKKWMEKKPYARYLDALLQEHREELDTKAGTRFAVMQEADTDTIDNAQIAMIRAAGSEIDMLLLLPFLHTFAKKYLASLLGVTNAPDWHLDEALLEVLRQKLIEQGPQETYTYLGKTFTAQANINPGNLIFFQFGSEDSPFLIESVENRSGLAFTMTSNMRPVLRFIGWALRADGWVRETKENSVSFDHRLVGNFSGVQSHEQLGSRWHPLLYGLVSFHNSEMGSKRREDTEKRREAEEILERQHTVGLLFLNEISSTIGYIPDTVEASALRSWFAQHGVKVSIKVRRYSMASGFDFKAERTPETQARMAKLSQISAFQFDLFGTGIDQFDNTTPKRDQVIFYPYVDSLATLLAQRAIEYNQKNPDKTYYKVTEKGQQIANGASITAMFGGPVPVVQPPAPRAVVTSPEATVAMQGSGYTITQEPYTTAGPSTKYPTRQSRTYDVWAVRFAQRFSKEAFPQIASLAKEHGGWFAHENRKTGRSSGFVFKTETHTESDALAFAQQVLSL